MSNITTFDNWFNKLPTSEQNKLVTHIVSTRLDVIMEGYNVGPSGRELIKGLFVGPSGASSPPTCKSCGKPL